MQSDRSRLRELEIRVANPQHWSSGEHQINVENLRQLRFQIEDQLKKLRQHNQPSALSGSWACSARLGVGLRSAADEIPGLFR